MDEFQIQRKRKKERFIGEVIKKVYEWRKYSNGVEDANGDIKRLTLVKAA